VLGSGDFSRIGTTIALFSSEMKNKSNTLHASLFSSGSWKTKGCYYDDAGKPTLAEGHTKIFHRSKHWFAKNHLHLSNSKTLDCVYQVEASGTNTANWTSSNSLLKGCQGRFQVQEDLILSTFSSEDGQFSGYEILQRLSDSHYTNLGELFFHRQRHSSSSLELVKIPDEAAGQQAEH